MPQKYNTFLITLFVLFLVQNIKIICIFSEILIDVPK